MRAKLNDVEVDTELALLQVHQLKPREKGGLHSAHPGMHSQGVHDVEEGTVRPSIRLTAQRSRVALVAASVLVGATLALVSADAAGWSVAPTVLYAAGSAAASMGYPAGLQLDGNGQVVARICFQNICAHASPDFVKRLVANEKGAFLLGEQTGYRQAQLKQLQSRSQRVLGAEESEGELTSGPGMRRFVPTTLQAILHQQARDKQVKKVEKPKWKSQWISIFGANYL
mmetsp:Transcript_20058/g.31383  ORF Transcript_20058/g.31383 Transcript_20058/m.31383 type:complete len:228 (-) Transcript_20058:32-715(-)|eukprot:CAMPEP_0184288902 /NCGR_PEP_ID=MMETSP1049-20130417/1411_1 /TAXON_ID=77928 /ORGANISM="Proteomonas sulcata, Strain CCMP704" /LENGTH=227 /DNA_ID=CAMNT_0026595507 /DNA_START=436 /DNA_END=1119 /DNA_ORIENTATION=+